MVQRQQRMFLAGTEHATLDSKNVLALRALFGLAHRLNALLGESWLLVVATVNCLDCILNTPRQSAQVHIAPVLQRAEDVHACDHDGHSVGW